MPEIGTKYWCFWEQRVMTYKGQNDKGEYVFEDEKGVVYNIPSHLICQLNPYRG